MLAAKSLPEALPALETLLVAGGDERILPNPASGVSPYGCRPYPDPDIVALGSSTASIISDAGFEAAAALHKICLKRSQSQPLATVYAAQTERLRAELRALCGFSIADRVDSVLAASGTDLHRLAAHWLKPRHIVMLAPSET